MILWLAACGLDRDPYPDYFADPNDGPVITGVSYDSRLGLNGGQELVISGGRLGTTRTVVVGTRNAAILDVTDTRVIVEVPAYASIGLTEDVRVATDFGITEFEDGFRYEPLWGDFVKDEVASVAFTNTDCPIQGYALDGGVRFPIWWCALEQGFADGIAWDGALSHPGMASEMSEVAPLSAAPPPGRVRVWGPEDRRPPTVPYIADFHSVGDAFVFRASRDFQDDLDFVIDRIQMAGDYYFYIDDVLSFPGPLARFYGKNQSYPDPIEIVGADGNELRLAEDAPSDAIALQIGFTMEEDDTICRTDQPIVTEGWTGTAAIDDVDGRFVTSDEREIALVYNDFSGFFFPEYIGGILGQSDVPYETEFIVHSRLLDEEERLGTVTSGEELVLREPDLFSGLARQRWDRDMTVRWRPGSASVEGPSFVVVDIRIYADDIADPNFRTEVYRILATGEDDEGELVINRKHFDGLPKVPNALGDGGVETGLWGDITIARHSLRKVPFEDGDLVVDFIHAHNGPIHMKRAE